MIRASPVLVFLVLAACATPDAPAPPSRRATADIASLPAMKTFEGGQVTPPGRANSAIARDFLDLAFRMESGRTLPRLTRFAEPVRVRVIGPAQPRLASDLDRLLARLRTEAGIEIRRAPPGEPAEIAIQAVPRKRLRRAAPAAACFVIPNVSDWQEYRRRQRSRALDWTRLARRSRAAIFLPRGASPQETRDCLHEELAQALGPLNDLYRLPDSVFNDDNFQTVLTGFDMLVLRAYYAPELANGMPRAAVARALPGVLARINPAGQGAPAAGAGATPRAWREAIETALGPGTPDARRPAAARKALRIARAQGWHGPRLAFSLFALGRIEADSDAARARAAFRGAGRIYAATPGADLQAAYVGMHLASFALSDGRPQAALRTVETHIPAARAAENGALLATLLLIKAEALAQMDRLDAARAARRESLGWARYGFGSEHVARGRVGRPREKTAGADSPPAQAVVR